MMEKQELISQYDRFLSQLREEIKEFYWLYNFFFIIESALVGAIFLEKVSESYLLIAKILGILFSIYWFWVMLKQKLWRDNWLDKIKDIEKELKYDEKFSMWPKDKSFFFGRGGLWKLLLWLPIGFIFIWLSLIIFSNLFL